MVSIKFPIFHFHEAILLNGIALNTIFLLSQSVSVEILNVSIGLLLINGITILVVSLLQAPPKLTKCLIVTFVCEFEYACKLLLAVELESILPSPKNQYHLGGLVDGTWKDELKISKLSTQFDPE